MALDLNSPEVKAELEQALAAEKARLESEYGGIKSNRDAILLEKKKLQEEYEGVRSKLGGIDPTKLDDIMSKVKEAEAAKALAEAKALEAEGKFEDAFNKRTETYRKDAETRQKALEEEVNRYRSEAELLQAEKRRFMVDSKVRDAAATLVEPEMMDYVLRLGRETFQLDENGQLEARTSDGQLILGKDGKTVLTPQDWIDMQRVKVPYIFKQSKGAGLQPNAGKGSAIRYSDDLQNAAAKAKYISDFGMDAYLDLPKRS